MCNTESLHREHLAELVDEGAGLRVEGLWLRVQDLGSKVLGVGSGVQGLGRRGWLPHHPLLQGEIYNTYTVRRICNT